MAGLNILFGYRYHRLCPRVEKGISSKALVRVGHKRYTLNPTFRKGVHITAVASGDVASASSGKRDPGFPQLPTPTGEWTVNIPVVGETLEYLKDPMSWVQTRVEKHGRVFKTHLFGSPGYVITDFDTYTKIYEGSHKSTAQFYPDSFMQLMGSAAADTFDREKHLRARRQVGAALSTDAIASYLPNIEKLARSYLAEWASQESVELEASLRSIAMDFAGDIVVGLGLDQEQKQALAKSFNDFTSNLFTIPVDLPGTPFHKAKKARVEVMNTIREHVAVMRERAYAGEFKKGAKCRTALTNYINAKLEDGDPLEIEGLAEQSMSLIVAGFDTSAWASLVLFALLPQLPAHILHKLREEQESIQAKHGNTMTKQAMADMKYAEAVVKEALRLKGPVTIAVKKAVTDLEVQGKCIPAGSIIFVSVLYCLAADPQVFRQSAKGTATSDMWRNMDIYDLEASFVPERWLDPATVPSNTGQFGAGPHSCLGQPLYMAEAKVMLALITRQYEMTLVKPGKVKWVPGSKVQTEEPVLVQFRERIGGSQSIRPLSERVQTRAERPVQLEVR